MHFASKKLKASSLYLAIFLALIVTLLVTGFITWKQLSVNESFIYQQHQKLNDDILSAKNIILSDVDVIGSTLETQLDLYNNGESIVNVLQKQWGVYAYLQLSTSWKNITKTYRGLYGSSVKRNNLPGLYLADQGRYLVVGGRTKLTGTCYLPSLGIKSATIEAEPYRYDKLVYGKEEVSSGEVPPLSQNLISYLKKFFSDETMGDSLVLFSELKATELNCAFTDKTMHIVQDESFELDGIEARGNILFSSNESIYIRKNAQLEDVICSARRIYVEKGFSGNCQLIASDTILIDKNVTLSYPSAVVLYAAGHSNGLIVIETNTVVQGTVILCPEIKTENNSEIQLKGSNQFYGVVYADGAIENAINVQGALFCNRFKMQTRRGRYVNHLLHAEIGSEGLVKEFSAGILFSDKRQGNMITILKD